MCTCISSCPKRRGITRRCSQRTPIATRRVCVSGWRWVGYILAEDYVRAMHLRDVLSRAVNTALKGCDALLLPAQPIPAPELGATTVEIDGTREPVRAAMLRLTQLFNITRSPVDRPPAGTTNDGWPIGMQLVGHLRATRRLIDLAARVERYSTGGDGSVGGGTG